MKQHKNDIAPRVLFGKSYVWLRSESGKLCLVPAAALAEVAAKLRKVLDK